jgi:DNA-binding MarR family transcriptional regulator
VQHHAAGHERRARDARARKLIARRPHPTHGRILQVTLTARGEERFAAATPAVRALEAAIERGLDAAEVARIKAWLVAAAQALT